MHETPGEVPRERLAVEPLRSIAGRPDYDTALTSHQQVTRDCFMSCEGVRYSAPASCCGQKVLVRATPEGILEIRAQNERVPVCRLSPQGNAPVVEPAHHAALWAALHHPTAPPAPAALGRPNPTTAVELEVEVCPLAEHEALVGGEQ